MMPRPKKADPGPTVSTYGEWMASVKQGGRGAWWWTLKRGDKTFATSRTGEKTQKAATSSVLLLLNGIKATDRVSELMAAAAKAQTDVVKEKVRADEAEARIESHNLKAQRAFAGVKHVKRANKMMWIVVVAVALIGWAIGAYAHPGGMSKDGCHKYRAADEVHWHSHGSERGGVCKRSKHFTVKYQTIEIPVAVEPRRLQ